MAQYINKSAVVAEIERIRKYYERLQAIKPVFESNIDECDDLLSFLETLKVKEVVEYDDSDANAVLSEFGVEPDSSFANSLKDAFCKAFDSYKTKD